MDQVRPLYQLQFMQVEEVGVDQQMVELVQEEQVDQVVVELEDLLIHQEQVVQDQLTLVVVVVAVVVVILVQHLQVEEMVDQESWS